MVQILNHLKYDVHLTVFTISVPVSGTTLPIHYKDQSVLYIYIYIYEYIFSLFILKMMLANTHISPTDCRF
jgi:hypothetical protein